MKRRADKKEGFQEIGAEDKIFTGEIRDVQRGCSVVLYSSSYWGVLDLVTARALRARAVSIATITSRVVGEQGPS